jgi:hypothetical protein
LGYHLYLAGSQVGILKTRWSLTHIACYADHVFCPQVPGHGVRLSRSIGVENNLRNTPSVAQVYKYETAVITATVYPAS